MEDIFVMKSKRVFSVRSMILVAIFIAMQIVLSRFLGIQVNEGLRISFECIPIFLAGLWLGPIQGILVAVLSDILGTILSGYGVYFPLLTVGPIFLGLSGGFLGKAICRKEPSARVIWILFFFVLAAETLNSLFYGCWALSRYYSIILGKEMPFSVLFAARVATKPFTIIADAILVAGLHRAMYRPIVSRIIMKEIASTKELAYHDEL